MTRVRFARPTDKRAAGRDRQVTARRTSTASEVWASEWFDRERPVDRVWPEVADERPPDASVIPVLGRTWARLGTTPVSWGVDR